MPSSVSQRTKIASFSSLSHMAADESEWLIDMGFTPEDALSPGYGPYSNESFLDPDRVEDLRRALSSPLHHHHHRSLPKKKKNDEPCTESSSTANSDGKQTGRSTPRYHHQQGLSVLPTISSLLASATVGGPRSPYFPGKYTVQCQECDKSFPCMSKLRRHEVVHTKAKPFKCDYCGKGFTQQCSVMVHISMMHRGGSAANSSIEEVHHHDINLTFKCDDV